MTIIVRKKEGESTDKLISRFRKQVIESNLIGEIERKRYYLKPSQVKKEKMYKLKRRFELQRPKIKKP